MTNAALGDDVVGQMPDVLVLPRNDATSMQLS
jgi:hypothetical protein